MRKPPLRTPVLCIITDGATEQAVYRVREALAGGATMIQLRCARETEPAEIVRAGRRLRQLTNQAEAALIINDRVELVDPIGADGAHVGPLDMPPAQVRAILGADRIVGYSVRAASELTGTLQDTIDYVGAGPVFQTFSKLSAGNPIGLSELREIASRTRQPAVAIGGITEDRIDDLARCGAAGIATISMLQHTKDAAALCRKILARFNAHSS